MSAEEPLQRQNTVLTGNEQDRLTAASLIEAGRPRPHPRRTLQGIQAIVDSSPRQAIQRKTISSWQQSPQTFAPSIASRSAVQRVIRIKSARGSKPSYPERTLEDLQKSLKYKNYAALAEIQSVSGFRAKVLLQIVASWTRVGNFQFDSLAALWKAAESEASASIDSDSDRKQKLETLRLADMKLAAAKFNRKSLHEPRLPEHFPSSSASAIKASSDGRDDGAFPMTANTLENAISSSTSRVNLALQGEQRATGNYEPNTSGGGSNICLGCGHAKDVADFQTDHQVAFSKIRTQLFEFALALEGDEELRKQAKLDVDLFDEYFALFTEDGLKRLYPTKTAMSHYSNDLGNLLSVCQQCNGAANKGALELKDWYLDNEFYGPAFIDVYWDDSESSVLGRTKKGGGWGDAARDWFQQHHLPILIKIFPSLAATHTLHERIRKQSTLAMAASSSSPSTKSQLDREVTHLGHSNDVATQVLTDVIGKVAPENLSEFGPNSPYKLMGNLTTGISNVLTDREAGKRDGPNVERSTRFDEGLANGRRLSIRLYPEGSFPQYDKGYDKGLEERSQLMKMPEYKAGLKDGKARKKRIHKGELDANALAYQLGYVDGVEGR